MRISLDNRSQARSLLIAEHMLTPHLGGISWEEVYQNCEPGTSFGMDHEALQYYWDDEPIYTMPTITKWGECGLNEALEQAAQGSPQAKFRLTRLIKSALDDPVSIRAAELLGNPSAGVTAGGTPKL